MSDTPFHAWKPTLRADVHLRDDRSGDLILLGPRGGFLAALPARWRPLLGRMDGRLDVGALLVEDARLSGRFDPRSLVGLLERLASLDAFTERPPRIPTAEATPTVLDRLLAGLGRCLDINLTGPSPAPWDPGRWTIPVFGLLVLVVHVMILFLFLDGVITSGEAGLPRALSQAGAAFGGLALSMTLRGLVRWYVLFIGRRPARRVGLRVRLGLPFLDVDPRAAGALSRTRQIALALSGIGALAVASGAMLFLPGGGPLAAVAGRAALAALIFDLCPFARSDGSLLLESILGISWLRGRTLRYLRQGLAARFLRGRASETEEWRLLLVLGLWAVWAGLALPLVAFPALRSALDITGALLADAVATEDALSSVLGLVIGLYLALLFCVVSVFGVLLAASFILRSLQALMPIRAGATVGPEPGALPEALGALGLDEGLAGPLAAAGRWFRLGAGDVFPVPGAPFEGVALLVAGRAAVQRREVSGLVHDVAEAGPGWVIQGQPGVPGWRWSLYTRGVALVLVLDPPVEDALGALAGRIRGYEDCPALWGLGPDGVRWAASHGEFTCPSGEAITPLEGTVSVLLTGSVEHETRSGSTLLQAPRVLPLPGPGEALRAAGASVRLLRLPVAAPGRFLPSWWSQG
ncbi:MAG: hypothetical protein ABIK09_00160 [Pseudomonadota bacterium]